MASNAKMLQSKLCAEINSTKITKPNRQNNNNNNKRKKEGRKERKQVTDKQQTKN